MFQGRKADFLPVTVPPRGDVASGTSTSLKRKRDIDDDADLYGEEEVTEKKRHESNNDNPSHNGKSITVAQTQAVALKADDLEWLIFLVSQEGFLQVDGPITPLTIDSTIK